MFFIYRLSYGGAARTIMNIVNHLDRNKFEPILVTLNYTFAYEQYLKNDVELVKLDTKRLRSSIVPLAKLIQKEQPHIDRKSTRLNSSHVAISYAVFCLKKKKQHID